MKDYRVSFYLGDMLHSYIVEAENEYKAIQKALIMPEGSAEILHDFKIEHLHY